MNESSELLSRELLYEGHVMEPHVIVMIVSLLIPNGEKQVQVTQYQTVDSCIQAANIEASDPFVQRVECAELKKGELTLRFGS